MYNISIFLSVLMSINVGRTKLETANNVLIELKELKKRKELPFLVIHRAIKMQEKFIKNI